MLMLYQLRIGITYHNEAEVKRAWNKDWPPEMDRDQNT
jgi:hypothetical protein